MKKIEVSGLLIMDMLFILLTIYMIAPDDVGLRFGIGALMIYIRTPGEV